jgi:hypothetical protein
MIALSKSFSVLEFGGSMADWIAAVKSTPRQQDDRRPAHVSDTQKEGTDSVGMLRERW